MMGGPALPPGVKEKKKYKPNAKTKRVPWDKVDVKKIQNTFWSQANDERYENLVRFGELESLFSASGKSAEKKEAEAPVQAKKEVTVIDPKKNREIAIALGRVKISLEDIKKFLLDMDLSAIEVQVLEAIQKQLPTKEEIEALSQFRNKPNPDLSKADQFLLAIMDIPMLSERISALLLRRRFDENVAEITPEVSAVKTASEGVRYNRNFQALLEIILLIGNYMNAGSHNERSYGFKLSFLNQLRDTKTIDNKSSLLHYIVDLAEEQRQELFTLKDELSSVTSASRVVLSNVHGNIEYLRKGVDEMEKALKTYKAQKKQMAGDKFEETMEGFVNELKAQVEKLVKDEAQMIAKYEECAQFYGINPKDMGPDEFFRILSTFFADFQLAREENARVREAARKEAERVRELELRRMKEQAKKRRTLILEEEGDQKGVMDELIDSLRTGEAFSRNKVQRKKKPNRQAVVDKANSELASMSLDSPSSSSLIATAPIRRRRKAGDRTQPDLGGDNDPDSLGDIISNI